MLALAALVVSLSIASPYFLTTNNVLNIGVAVALVGVVAAGSTLVMIAGGLDVSVGSTVALAGVSAASVLSSTSSVALAIAAGVVVGGLAGLFNGLIITKLNINPLIATLGTLSVYRGLTFIVSDGVAIGVTEAPFLDIGSGRLAGIPNPLVILLVVFAVLAVVLHATDIGRNVYAIGGNAEAARLAGIRVDRYRTGLYTLNGLLAGLAGVVLTARLGSAQPLAGAGLELDAIAAVVLGGVALAGGIGTIGGTVLGVLVLGVLNNGLTILAIDSFYQYVARGGVLLVAVALDQAGQARRERARARSTPPASARAPSSTDPPGDDGDADRTRAPHLTGG
ncbi:ribose ABC transporter permease [Jiangella asiatica]|uniref:Ribose ABC transporter permease n=2 Tax=Jiangella asiatica TaxID=2530372 RepID=A0A4R5D8Q5_9ACTN|nr:ribose ABC transporter permease [Jiangella asiatica]